MAQFTDNRYITCGVQAEIHPILQASLWNMIDNDISNGLPVDYLQIFKLKPVMRNGKECQEIIHLQEQPKRDKKTIVDFGITPVSAKIFVIDSGEYVTMMLASEY